MKGAALLSLFRSIITIGRSGALYESLTPTAFVATHAAIAAIDALLALLLARPLARVLNRCGLADLGTRR